MKKFITIIFLLIFTSSNVHSSEKCNQYKKLTKNYLKCISGKLNLKNKATDLSLDTSNIKEKKTISDWFKKKQ